MTPADLERMLSEVNASRSARDDAEELERDVEVALGAPSTRLAVYGTLAPGESNHHVIAPAGGSWRRVDLVGVLGEWEGYPMFEWDPMGAVVAAWLLESDDLSRHWGRLDEFETRAYDRHLVPCVTADDEVVRRELLRAGSEAGEDLTALAEDPGCMNAYKPGKI